jgi:hypothetical protein
MTGIFTPYMCTCVYVCVRVCVYVCMYVWVYVYKQHVGTSRMLGGTHRCKLEGIRVSTALAAVKYERQHTLHSLRKGTVYSKIRFMMRLFVQEYQGTLHNLWQYKQINMHNP